MTVGLASLEKTLPRTLRFDTLAAVRDHFEALFDQGSKDALLDQILALLSSLTESNTLLEQRLYLALRRLYGSKSRVDALSDKQELLLSILAATGGVPTDPTAVTASAAGDSSQGAESTEPTAPATPPATPPTSEPPSKPKPKPKGHGRNPIPEDLLRRIVPLDVDSSQIPCPIHGGERAVIDTRESRGIEWVPGHFELLLYQRITRACSLCHDADNVVTGPCADKLIDKGLPGPNLLAELVVNKCVDHLPLNRQSERFARDGLRIAPSTLGDWFAFAADLAEPLWKRFKALVFAAKVLTVDDTPMPVLDRDHAKGIAKHFQWGMIGDDKWVYFECTQTRTHAAVTTLLKDRTGYLQGDGFDGYSAWASDPDAKGERIVLGCHSHGRRKLKESADLGDPRALVGIALVRELYALEERWDAEGIEVAARTAARERESQPVLTRLRAWVDRMRPQCTPKSRLGKALTYYVNQWAALTGFVKDGAIRLDTNHVERLLRGPAQGRKAWLFYGSKEGAKSGSILMTLVGNARVAGIVDLRGYLRDVFEKLSRGWPQAKLDELLPQNWAREQREKRDRERLDTLPVT